MKLRILLVEDNPADCELTLRELRRSGIEAEWKRVESEEEYREEIKADYDIILSDYSLPSFDGFRALEILRESGRDIPFILISGTVGEETAVQAMKYGASDYLLKDRLARLGEAVRNAVAHSREQRERLQSKSALRSKTAILQAMVDSADYGILIVDPEGRKLLQNEQMNEMWNIPPDIANDQGDTSRLHHVAFQTVNPGEFLKRVGWLYSHRHETGYDEVFLLNGKVYERYSAPVEDENGTHYGRIWSFRDITERKRAELELAESSRRLELAVQAAGMGIWQMDLASGKLTMDARSCEILGLDFEAFCQRRPLTKVVMEEVIHLDDLPRINQLFDTFLRGEEEIFDVEFRIVRRANGEVRVLHSRGILAGDDGASRAVGVQWDVTEARVHERELHKALDQEKQLVIRAKAAERAKGEFLAAMSHEIRTPMNGILGFAEILVEAPGLPDDSKDHARTILASSQALLRILDDVLDYSSMEEGHLRIHRTSFSPGAVVMGTRALLAAQAARKGLSLHVHAFNDIPDIVEGDAGRLRQILLNLGGNAIKFTEQGEASISIRRCENAPVSHDVVLEFIVRDTGAGIPEEQLNRIFEPFAQGDSALARKHGGTGLGLSISRRLAELMGGMLTVESKVGEGTQFIARLPFHIPARPVADPRETPRIDLQTALAQNHPLDILVVEDDAVNLKLVVTLLRKLGYNPRSARNGREAVSAAQDHHPDCILMDLQMPEMDGLEATQKIRNLERNFGQPHSYIVAITANVVAEDRQRCLDIGMDAYLNKPIKRKELVDALVEGASKS